MSSKKAVGVKESPQPSESLLESAKRTYRQTMPEELGGGYPVQAGIIKDENGNILSEPKPILEQAKEKIEAAADKVKHCLDQNQDQVTVIKKPHPTYVDYDATLAAAKGKIAAKEAREKAKRAPTLSKKTPPHKGKKSLDTTSHDHEVDRAEPLLESVKRTYRQAMPEALGGGYPVQAGIIKDEHGNIISGQQNGVDQKKESLDKTKDQTVGKSATDPTEMNRAKATLEQAHSAEQAKDQIKVATEKAKPYVLKAVEEAKPYLLKAVEKAEPYLVKAMEEAKPHLDQAKDQVEVISELAKPFMEQTKAQLTEAAEKAKPHLDQAKGQAAQAAEKAKDVFEENMPEALGGKQEKPTSNEPQSLLRQAKVAYRENMPEILGGRPSSIPEVLRAVVDREVDAHKQKEEAKKFEQLPAENQSILDKAKHSYREKMPAVLGGRPATISELLQPAVDNLKKGAQEEVDNLKSSYEDGTLGEHVKERAKEVYKNTMPESVGGRPPTLTEKAVTAIVKNRANALIEGTKEQLENTTG